MLLEEKYKQLIAEYDFKLETNTANVNYMIRDALAEFVSGCKVPAIWCYGEHTKMLMADFMNELRTVKFIIDGHAEKYSDDSGFKVIYSKETETYRIDGIIISSFKFRNEIKAQIQTEFPSVKYLDLYDYFEKNGVFLRKEYYLATHPYSKYGTINRLKFLIKTENDIGKKEKLLFEIIKSLVEIKDFFLAVKYAQMLCGLNNDKRNNRLLNQLKEIYNLECRAAEQIDENNILMLCLDGMRNKDISDGNMPKFNTFVQNNCRRYTNAYSVSTSTYESLVPVYSENVDMRTKYYESNCIAEEQCRFIQKAKQQKRNIYFYTDFASYVDSEEIIRQQAYETATEKLWSFILDAVKEKNGLFYVHILYESHYSYPNPYIDEGLVAEGTSIMFDFLSKNGGKLRTDYEMQHSNSLRYLDDILTPILERMKGRMFLFADHGNIIPDRQMKLEDIPPLYFTYHDDLIHIPFIIKSPEMSIEVRNNNISLLELNEVLICLMEKREFTEKQPVIVKTQRSAIYNPDFQYLYRKSGQEQGLQAYENFIFEDESQLTIYENGYMELVENGVITDNDAKKGVLLDLVKERVTVCECDQVVKNLSCYRNE